MICPSCNDHHKFSKGVITSEVTYINPNTFVRRTAWFCHRCGWKMWVGYTAEEFEDEVYSDSHVQVALWYAYNNGNPTNEVMIHDAVTVLDRLAEI